MIAIKMQGELTCSNGTTISVDARAVTIRTYGPKGGRGDEVVVPLGEWDMINQTVALVRAALGEAESVVSGRQLLQLTAEDQNR